MGMISKQETTETAELAIPLLFLLTSKLLDDHGDEFWEFASKVNRRVDQKLRPVDHERLEKYFGDPAVYKVKQLIRKHNQGTEHDHDQKDHTPKEYRDKNEFSTDKRREEFGTLVRAGEIVPDEEGKYRVEATGRAWEDPEKALAHFHRFTARMGMDRPEGVPSPEESKRLEERGEPRGPSDIGDIEFDPEGGVDLDLGLRGLFQREGESVDPDALGESAATFAAEKGAGVRSDDAFSEGMGKMIDTYVAGDIGAKEFAQFAEAWRAEFNDMKKGKGKEVDKTLRAMDLISSLPKDKEKRESLQYKNEILHDVVNLFGKSETQKGVNVLRATFQSGGEVPKEDLFSMPGGQQAFGGGANIGSADARRDQVVKWLDERRSSTTEEGSKARLIEELGLGSTFELGAIFGDRGEVYQVSRPRSDEKDEFLPFSFKDTLKMRDRHVVRGRNMGGITGADLFMSVIAPPKSITVTSNTGTYKLDLNPQFRDSLRARWDLWRAYRGIEKRASKMDVQASTHQILNLIHDDFPNAFSFKTVTRREFVTDEGEPTDLAGKAVRTLRERGLLPLSDEALWQGDPEMMAAIERPLREVETIRDNLRNFYGGELPPDVKEKLEQEHKKVVEEFENRKALATLMAAPAETRDPSRREHVTSGYVPGGSSIAAIRETMGGETPSNVSSPKVSAVLDRIGQHPAVRGKGKGQLDQQVIHDVAAQMGLDDDELDELMAALNAMDRIDLG